MPRQPANWAGNVVYRADRIERPRTVEELQHLVAANERVRALGTGHSFNRIADSSGVLISVAGLPPVMEIDTGRASVTASAGLRYGDLAPRLHVAGYALHNLGSLPHISVSGACATGTHGSGDANGNLATAVSAMEIVTADGEVMVLSRDGGPAGRERFRGAVVGLGALGIVTSLVLDIVPAFDVRQHVYDDLPAERLNTCFAEIFASGYSVSVFTDWLGAAHKQLWVKRRADDGGSWRPEQHWMDARLADGPRHPVPGMPPAYTTRQLGVPGPWHERLPHFRLDFTPSGGEELQSEYLVPRDRAVAAFDAMAGLGTRIGPVLQISEIRTVASDDLWLSPSYHRDTIALHFTWIKDMAAVTPVIAAVEERLAPLAARPHWGKLFGTAPSALAALYERFPDFLELIRGYDPVGKFRNEFMGSCFMAAG
ncbi:MAG TPA: FAD-binding protein [Streptosporangiaceae bacterium]|nr:FAD-binding protein [Streptosporangiaceae bacterium]